MVLSLCLVWFVSSQGKSQNFPPYIDAGKGDQQAFGPASATRNTGTDYWAFGTEPGRGVQVMVWDGNPAVFSWHYQPDQNTTLKGHYKLSQLISDGAAFDYLPNCDPDVVVAEFDQDPEDPSNRPSILAMVVGLAVNPESGQVQVLVTSFIWSSNKFIVNTGVCNKGQFWLGNVWGPNGDVTDGDYESLGRNCQSPNIDVNRAGQVAMAWTEVEQNLVGVWIINPVPPFAAPTPIKTVQTVTKGNVYADYGYINGTTDGLRNGPCIGGRGRCGKNEFLGDRRTTQFMNHFPIALPGEVTDDGTNYLYSFPTVDVAISDRIGEDPEDYRTVSSFVYLRTKTGVTQHAQTQTFPNELLSGLFVHQVNFNQCTNFTERSGEAMPIWREEILLKRNLSGPPRIASPEIATGDIDIVDFTVVQGRSGAGCDDGGYFFNSSLKAWCRVGNSILNEGSELLRPNPNSDDPLATNTNLNTNITLRENTQPVVTYCNQRVMERNGFTYPGSFTVIWQTFDETLPELTATGRNILGASYWPDTDPALIGLSNVVHQYPFLFPGNPSPKYVYSYINHAMSNRQVIPSIAGRFGAGQLAYDWDGNLPEVGPANTYKRSEGAPGVSAVGNSCPDCQFRMAVVAGQTGDIVAEPNPGSDRFVIRVNLSDKEQISGYSILDMAGKQVFQSTQLQKKDFVEWKPTPDLKPGLYQVKVLTTKRVLLTRLLKQ